MNTRIDSCFGERPCAVGEIAHRVSVMSLKRFGIHDLDFRIPYFERILRSGPACLAVLTHVREDSDFRTVISDIGYISVIPLVPYVAKRHMSGRFDEFDFDEDAVADLSDADPSNAVYIYVQAVTLDVDVKVLLKSLLPRRLERVMPRFEEMFWEQMRGLGLTDRFKDVTVYAEITSEEGRRQAVKRGLRTMVMQDSRETTSVRGGLMYSWNTIAAASAQAGSPARTFLETFLTELRQP